MENTAENDPHNKPLANSRATAGQANRDEDGIDSALAAKDTSKGFDRDQEELALGLDDGDLDRDLGQGKSVVAGATRARELDDARDLDFTD